VTLRIKITNMGFLHKEISTTIYDSIFTVHRALGPGLLESTYEICLKKEMEDAGLLVEQQKPVPIFYKGILLEAGYRVDLMVENKIILELKAVETMNPIYQAQLMSYLRLADCQLGFLVNFNVILMKDGIKRIVM
jgi:GxxExxY protein